MCIRDSDEATALKMKRQDKIALAEKGFELAIKTKDQNLADEALKLLGDNIDVYKRQL